MYGREELKLYWGGATLDYDVYKKDEADKVMDAMEQRIKELEEENKHLDDYIDAYQKSEALDIAKMDKKDERIKELEKEIDAGSTGMRMLEEKCKAIETREKEMVEILNSRLAEIRTQEGRIAELEAEVIGYKASLERANFKMCEKDARIKELEECCKWCNGNALPPPPTTEESSAVDKEK